MALLTDKQGNEIWKPTLKQERFLSIPLTVKESFYAGAVNAGKSDVLLMYPLVHRWHLHPEFKGVYLRRTMPELRNEIIPRAKGIFDKFGATFNKQDSCFTFPSGALYFFTYCQYEDDVHNFDTMQINYAGFDELTSFTEWMYLYITIERVRVNKILEGKLPAISRSGSNPGDIGHPWVYKRFIKPLPLGGKILVGRGGIKRIFIPATIDDNPHASEQYKKELDALPEAERKAKKYGDWSAYEGQVFDEFREKHYPSEPDNALHMIKEFEIPIWWPKVLAIDWGFNAMTWCGWGAISPNGRVYLYREQHFYNVKISVWGAEVRPYIDKDDPQDIVICHSANQHRGEPHTILEQVSDVLGRSIRLGEKDRIAGKMLIHEYLRWKPIPRAPVNREQYNSELAGWLLRNKGVKIYKNYLDSFVEQPEENNLPKLLIFDQCTLVSDAIKSCVYEKSASDGKKKEDVAEFPGDDPYDGLRMLLHGVDKFFLESHDMQEKLAKQQKLLEDFEKNQDMTMFYRNARRLETESDEYNLVPVNRYNNRRGYHATIH